MKISASDFYELYQVNHFNHIQLMLYEILKDQQINDSFKFKQNILSFDEHDFKRSIKIQIRQTYFQAIETLFSFIFILKPDKGKFYESDIFQRISHKTFFTKKIKSIAEDDKYLSFLDEIIEINNLKITTSEFLFYYGRKINEDKVLKESLNSIKKGLKLLAIDLSDTKEYNSYKHCLRSIPFLKSFTIASKDDLSNLLKFDMSETMTYYDYNDKTFEIQYVAKGLDTDRDIRMTELASNLLSNIICLRKLKFTKDRTYSAPVIFFSNDYITECNKHTEGIPNLTFTMKPKRK